MENLGPDDRFHETLNDRDLASNPRDLITVVGSDWNSSAGVIIGQYDPVYAIPASPTRGSRRLTDVTITRVMTPDVTAAHLGFFTGSAASRDSSRSTVLNWLHGVSRPGARMGDIYHSNPTVASPPIADIADESFNLWRRLETVNDRPPVIYVGTNDGILHAFAVESFRTRRDRVIRVGEELWGFVPPAVLSRIESARGSHQILLDGTPVIRNVFYRRRPGDLPTANSYHTVLVQGLRGGGPFYIAMDVSDPLDPKFLWQFTRPEMGPAIGRAGVGQVLVHIEGVLQQRAVAVFGGGGGELVITGSGPSRGWGTCSIPPGASRRGVVEYPGRSARRCWLNDQGRSLYVVDIATGEVIREFGADTIASPMTGSVSLFTGETGTMATRAYTVDADGALWRLDMSNRNPDMWSLETIHDLYWADSALAGASSQDPPIVSVDSEGQVVVIVGTGNVDDLEGQDLYRVASVTDRVSWSATGVATYAPRLNWEIRLQPGEQVTGPMELFMSRVYFSTFSSTSSDTGACQWGGSKVWGVDYIRTGTWAAGYSPTGTTVSPFPGAGLESTPGSGVFDRHFTDMSLNSIAMGVAIASTPTCVVGSASIDPYLGTRFSVSEAGGGAFRLVSQLSGPTAGIATGTSVSLYNIELPRPPSITRVLSWASNADY
jgi:type IV pilus assembly protein PilY1